MKPNQTRRQRRRAERAQFWAKLGQRRALIATIATVIISIAVAIPSQLDWFLDRVTHGEWDWPDAGKAIAYTLLIEGLCWLAAILYADATRHGGPVRIYRLAMLAFAGLAAGINYDHGQEIGGAVGIVSALGSLMGVGAWELYMHRTRHQTTGLTLADLRLRWLRWLRHPRVMWRAKGHIAVHGLTLTPETAWRMAYRELKGNPTVPIAVSSALVNRVLRPEPSTPTTTGAEPRTEPATIAEPSAGLPKTEPALGVDIRDHPVSWDDAKELEAILAIDWEEPDSTATAAPASAPGQSRKTAEAGTRVTREPAVTSAVPRGKRNSPGPKTGTGKVRFNATKTELDGPGDARDRILRYLTRAETKGHKIAELDRNHIAAQFTVSDRYVRNVIADHNTTKEK